MRAVAYARFSSDNQREESIDAQLRAIRKYCLDNDIDLVYEYTDEAKSATTDNRPGFQRMFQELEQRDVSMLIVHKLDRFSRNRYDSAIYKRKLQQLGIKLISVLERIDDTPESIIMQALLEGMSEYYSANLAREVRKGLNETALQCKHTGGKPPLGYDVGPDRRYVINEQEAAMVRTIFSMYAAGRGYSDILAAMEGKQTKGGGSFGKNSLHDLLHNEKYIGVYVFNRSAAKVGGKRNNHKSKSEDEIVRIPGGMPRIIDDATWALVQERLHNNRRNASAKQRQVYVLAGKLVCGCCGSVLVGKSSGANRAAYYMCGTRDRKGDCSLPRLQKESTEKEIMKAIGALWSIDAEAAADTILATFASMGEPEDIRRARHRITEIDRQLNNLLTAIMNGVQHPDINDKIKQLQLERVACETTAAMERTVPTREEIISFIHQLAGIADLSKEQQKELVTRIIEQIIVSADGSSCRIIFKIKKGTPPGGGVPMVEAVRHHAYSTFEITYYRTCARSHSMVT